MSKREELNKIIDSLSISHSYIAKKLGLKVQTLEFLLNDDEKFDDELYDEIKDLINNYQFSFFDSEPDENYSLFDEIKFRQGIGERIRVFAKKKYGTLKNLADEMQISPQQLQQYISGKREPGSKILIKLLKLGCDINWLLSGSESFESYKIYKLENEVKNLHESLAEIEKVIHKHRSHH